MRGAEMRDAKVEAKWLREDHANNVPSSLSAAGSVYADLLFYGEPAWSIPEFVPLTEDEVQLARCLVAEIIEQGDHE